MLGDLVGLLRCPHCAAELAHGGSTVGCPNGHSFDVARQGYASLLTGDARTGTADTREMVGAREAFLGAGHYEPAADSLAAECARVVAGRPGGAIVDVGAGTGYYLARTLDLLPDRVGLALDVSKHALRRAAGAHPRIGAVACDAWRALPVRTGVAAAVLSVFSPRNGAEMRRILRPDGILLLITPTPRHLAELTAALGLLSVDERKEERLEDQLGPFFELTRRSEHEWVMALGHADVEHLVGMGPSARHTDPERTPRRSISCPTRWRSRHLSRCPSSAAADPYGSPAPERTAAPAAPSSRTRPPIAKAEVTSRCSSRVPSWEPSVL